jgi:hypothetical protein
MRWQFSFRFGAIWRSSNARITRDNISLFLLRDFAEKIGKPALENEIVIGNATLSEASAIAPHAEYP